jgi:hypothetical protein
LASPLGKILEGALSVGDYQFAGRRSELRSDWQAEAGPTLHKAEPYVTFHHYGRGAFFDGGVEKIVPIVVGAA